MLNCVCGSANASVSDHVGRLSPSCVTQTVGEALQPGPGPGGEHRGVAGVRQHGATEELELGAGRNFDADGDFGSTQRKPRSVRWMRQSWGPSACMGPAPNACPPRQE